MKVKISFCAADEKDAAELEKYLKAKYPRAKINHPDPKGRYRHTYIAIAEYPEK